MIPRSLLLLALSGALPFANVFGQGSLATEPEVRSLDDAIARVTRENGGEVLSAESIATTGHSVDYRIKVLTAQGHIKVIKLSSAADNFASDSSLPSIKSPAAVRPGNKEKH